MIVYLDYSLTLRYLAGFVIRLNRLSTAVLTVNGFSSYTDEMTTHRYI